jgi:hypothetical protein
VPGGQGLRHYFTPNAARRPKDYDFHLFDLFSEARYFMLTGLKTKQGDDL